MKKKIVRVNLTVDLEVDKNYTKEDIERIVAVGKYEENSIYLKADDFEVVEYRDTIVEEL